MQIFVIRHTKVQVGNETCYGQANVALADSFLEEVDAVKEKLPTDFDAVYSSPLDRCKMLSTALKLEDIQNDKRLIEFNFGDWENKLWNDLDQTELNNWMQDFVNIPAPNGENVLALYERVSSFLDEMRNKKHEKILLITHAGVIRCIWSYLLEMPLKNMFKIPVGFGEILVFNLGNDKVLDAVKQKM
jgi:alpha-ribazole phosphatase